MFDKYRVAEGKEVKLKDYDPADNGKFDRAEMEDKTAKNLEALDELQYRLYAEGKRSLLIVLQAMDAGGKDSTIRKVFGILNPQGVHVTSFKAPTAEELSHDFLWRIHRNTPAKGIIGIFNRSHYEDVLIVRVNNWIDDKECERRYKQINEFERMLTGSGTTVLKFYLYISKDEQKKRFMERLNDPTKKWKFCKGDLDTRKQWDEYMSQFEDVFRNTSTGDAPWVIVPADNKRYRNLIISSIVRETLEKMNLKYPEPEEGLDKIVIE
ncbi:MAG: polyphosphate kinase [Spirochaetes bacterium GWF1_49_6]|nr:MAG: polyphosphate kinase [Spirochaetes bacterium GWF1_49_6]